MDITFNCEKCGQPLTIDESGAGQLVDCPKCGTPLEVPQKSKPLATENTSAPHQVPAPPPDRKCPVCAEMIKSEAKICRFCAYDFATGQRSAPTAKTESTGTPNQLPKILTALFIIAVIAVGSFFVYRFNTKQQTANTVVNSSLNNPVEKNKQATTTTDPVAELKQAMNIFTAKSKATDFSFDVKKTDSLVSPYLGEIKYVLSGEEYPVHCTISVASQEQKWVVKRSCCSLDALTETILWCDDSGKPEAFLEDSRVPSEIRVHSQFASKYHLYTHAIEQRVQWEDALRAKF